MDAPIPGTSAIALTFATPSWFSIWTMTCTSLFAAFTYSKGFNPQLIGAKGLPKPRRPSGGKRASATMDAACSAVETYTTMFMK